MAKNLNRRASAKTSPSQYAIYGNLLYYPNSPQGLIFFETLSDKDGYNERRGIKYQLRARQVYQQGLQHLNSNTLTADGWLKHGSEEYENKINAIIEFLKHAIDTEQENQLQYFKAKKDLIRKKFTDEEINGSPQLKTLVDYLQSVSTNLNNFSYEYFIVLINSLLQGREYTKNSIIYEKNRLQEVQNVSIQLTQQLADNMKKQNQVNDLSLGMERRYYEESRRQIKIHYIEQKELLNYDTSLLSNKIKNVIQPTIDQKIAELVRNSINHVWEDPQIKNDFATIILNYYKQKQQKPLQQTVADKMKEVVTKSVLNYVSENLDKISNSRFSSNYTNQILNDVLNQLKNDMGYANVTMTGLPNNLFWTTQLAYFDQYVKDSQRAKGLFDAIDKFYKQAHKTKIKNLSKDQKITYNALGLRGQGKTDKAVMQSINFVHELERLAKQLHQQLKKNKLQTNDKITRTVTRQLDGKKQEKEFVFTVDQHGRLIIPDDFKSYYAGAQSAAALFQLKNSSAHTLQSLISAAKGKLSRFFVTKLNNLKNNGAKQQLLNTIKNNIRGEAQMNISGPTFNEIVAGLQIQQRGEELVIYFPGYENNKNDLITISMNMNADTWVMQMQKLFSDNNIAGANEVIQDIMDTKKRLHLQFQKNFSKAMNDMKKNDKLLSQTGVSGFHNYREKANAFYEQWNRYHSVAIKQLNDLYTIGVDLVQSSPSDKFSQEQNQKYKQLAHELEQTFYRTDTMKSYAQYQNDVGFVGGSIGTTLTQQLNAIAMIFEMAGYPLDNLNLLQDLIMNTGPETIIKYKYRRPIETYLGALAAFMLFDEGGAEVEILQKTLTQNMKNAYTGPKILHLYRLNGLFYPGSYILAETLRGVEMLNLTISQIPKGTGSHGTTIRIVNKMTTNNIPKNSTSPWQNVAQSAIDGGVSLHITFLAGMAQILNNLQQTMNKIVIP